MDEIIDDRLSGRNLEMLESHVKLGRLQHGVLSAIKAGDPDDLETRRLRAYYLESGGALPEGD